MSKLKKALILNSGLGTRMGILTTCQPKCMTNIFNDETILSRQLKQLTAEKIEEVIVTTGPFEDILSDYCKSLKLPISIRFVNNPLFRETNYIYSIYCAEKYLDRDIILMHGDLVFETAVLRKLISQKISHMVVSSTLPLPQKDFKAVVIEGRIRKIGIEFFEDALSAQPIYFLTSGDWNVWLENIINFCQRGKTNCYAENALNEVTDRCAVYPLDVRDMFCKEIDTLEDLEIVRDFLKISREGI